MSKYPMTSAWWLISPNDYSSLGERLTVNVSKAKLVTFHHNQIGSTFPPTLISYPGHKWGP